MRAMPVASCEEGVWSMAVAAVAVGLLTCAVLKLAQVRLENTWSR